MLALKLSKYYTYFNPVKSFLSTSQLTTRYLHTSEHIMATKRPRVENDHGEEENGTHGSETTFPHFGTDAIHAGQDPKRWRCMAVTPLICMSSTFAQDKPGNCPGVSVVVMPLALYYKGAFMTLMVGVVGCVTSGYRTLSGLVNYAIQLLLSSLCIKLID